MTALDDGIGPQERADGLRRRLEQLEGRRQVTSRERARQIGERDDLDAKLARAPRVEARLNALSHELFGRLKKALEENLSAALQEVLEQPLRFSVETDVKRGSVSLSFRVLRGEDEEDIMRGQGGSVTNVLSVGLRFFALAALDERIHRRFLVLDEQDCWLRPDLVPRLVKIVHDSGKALGFQVLMISHHDLSAFQTFADRIYRLTPHPDGVRVVECGTGAHREGAPTE